MKEYLLENQYIAVKFLDLGGVITHLVKKANHTDYILSYSDYSRYWDNPYFLGATIGRVAGRVFPPQYQNTAGQTVFLDTNEGRLHLHGGERGLHKQIWSVEQTGDLEYTLSIWDDQSPYDPMYLEAVYRLDKNVFSIEYKGQAAVPTLCNLTNHMYFNLNADKKTIADHRLTVSPAKIQIIDEEFIPTGIYDDMKFTDNAIFDFRATKLIKEALNKGNHLSSICSGGIDLAYVFDDKRNPKIQLSDYRGENSLKIYSNQESCVLYTLNKIGEEVVLNNGRPIEKYGGITFEMQKRPNYLHENKDCLEREYFAKTAYEII